MSARAPSTLAKPWHAPTTLPVRFISKVCSIGTTLERGRSWQTDKQMKNSARVAIVMGSDSDLEIMREAAKALEGFGIAYEMDIASAHRSPARTSEFARNAASRGIRVIIAGAGGAAHLAGVIAAETTLPVIGVPIPSTSLQGLDSLLSIVQMPAGIPVATVAIGKAGATNAGILAAQMLALDDEPVATKLTEHKRKLA